MVGGLECGAFCGSSVSFRLIRVVMVKRVPMLMNSFVNEFLC